MKETFRKKQVRISLILLGFLLVLFFSFQWLVRYHTKDLIEELIAEETKGKVRLDIGKLNLSIFPNAQIDLHNTRVEVMDNTGLLPSYAVRIKHLGLKLQSLRSFLFQRQLLLDYFVAQGPEISIYPHVKEKKKEGNALVHVELGNVYLAMKRIAETMRVKKFGIFDGKLHIGSPRPDDFPVDLIDIDFQVDEFVMAAPADGKSAQGLEVNKLKLRTGRQDITFPNGDYRMKYASLEINSADNSVRIDSFFISGMTQDTAYGSLEAGFKNLRLVNIDFKALYQDDLLKVDSLYCQDPNLSLNLDLTASRITREKKVETSRIPTRGTETAPRASTRDVQDTRVEKRIADLLGKLNIGYLGFINSDIRINTKNGRKYTPFSTRGNNFEAVGIRINSNNPNPIEIDNLVFAIKNYKASTADSLYDFYFDSVAYRTGVLALKNFRLEPSLKNQLPDKKFLSIPDFELREISLVELISNKRFKARELVLKNSRTTNYFVPKSRVIRAPQPIKTIIAEISKTVDLEHVRLENAYLLNESATDRNQRVIVTGIYSDISANQMLRAPSYQVMGYSVGYLRFDSMHMDNGSIRISMRNGKILGKEQRITAEQIRFSDQQSRTSVLIEDAVIQNYQFDDEFQRFTIDSLHWRKAIATLDLDRMKKNPEGGENEDPISWSLGHMLAQNTSLQYLSGDSVKAAIDLSILEIGGLSQQEDKKIALNKLHAAGNQISYAAPGINASTGLFSLFESSRSQFRDIQLAYQRKNDTIKARIPSLEFVPRIAEMIGKKYPVIKEIIIDHPVVFASLEKEAHLDDKKAQKGLPMDIGPIEIRQAELELGQRDKTHSSRFRTRQLDLSIDMVQKDIGTNQLALGKSQLQTPLFDVRLNDSIYLMMDEGRLNLAMDHVRIGRGTDSGMFNAGLRLLEARDLSLLMFSRNGAEPLELNRFDLGGENLQLDSLDKAHILRRLKANPSLYVKDINLRKTTANADIFAHGIAYRNGGRMVSIDSIRYKPLVSRDSFSNTLEWQKVYLDDIHTGRITIHDFDIERLITDSSLQIRKVEIAAPYASIYKDKRIPFNFSTIKPLPTDLIKTIRQRVHIDSITLTQASLDYEEFNDKTKRLGSVHFKDMRALIRNVDTYHHGPKDSLYLLTNAVMEDSVRLRLRVDQSYSDTLSAFYMSARISPFHLPALNPMLEPLASARVVSGELDTLQLRVIGREYIAHGKMKLYYRDLKVNILDKSNQQKKTVGTRLINFVANLLIDRKNAQKTGTVFAERVRERGFLNYWIKIVLSGALTNTGIRKNTKAEKKYRKALKKDHVPEIEEVDL